MPNKGITNAKNSAINRGVYLHTRVYGDLATTVGKPGRMLGNSGQLPARVNGTVPGHGMMPNMGVYKPMTTANGRR